MNEPNLRIVDTLLWILFGYETKNRKRFDIYHDRDEVRFEELVEAEVVAGE